LNKNKKTVIKYRLAKTTDAFSLARVHKKCAEFQQDGFFHKLGILFIWRYYKIVLSNKNSFILLAEDQNGLLGFHSGTLKAEEHLSNLKKNRISLFFSVIPELFVKPKLFFEAYKRYRYVSKKNTAIKFGVTNGPRGEYWGWDPENPDPLNSLKLHKKWHLIVKSLGIKFIKSEVDITNKRVLKSIKLMGGEIISEVILPDGRKRAIVQYDLKNWI
jgi:hypothetical protein